MIINFLKKKIIESIIKEAIGKLPELKEMALLYLEQHKDEILEEVKAKVVTLIMSKIGH